MKPRIVLPTIAAAALLGLGALFVGAPERAGAQSAKPDVIYDEQNVTTDENGHVLLEFAEGEHNSECLSGKALYVGVAPARNLDNPGNAPVTFQAAHHQACNVLLVLLNKDNRPVRDDLVRITYTASAVATLDAEGDTPAPPPPPEPEPSPEPEPTPDPDPEPGDSLLIAAGGAILPQGVTAIGDVEPGDHSGVVPAGELCYFALLASTDTSNGIVGTAKSVIPTAPESFTAVVPSADDDPEVKFIHVDCAA